jgi:peptidyl-prolyl cis-trans isomerase D
MLTNIRKAADSWWFKSILIVIVITFCWTIGTNVRGSGEDRLVTFKKANPITGQEFLNAQKNEITRIQNLTGNPLTTEQIHQLNIPSMIIEQLINSRMLTQLVQQYNLDFTNNLMLEQIKKLPVFQNDKGVFDPKLFAYVLHNAGISEEDYIKRIKDEIAEQIVISMFASNALAPKLLVQNIADYLNEVRTMEIVSIDATNVPLTDHNFSQETLQNYYEAHKQSYTVPESRNFTYGLLSKDSLKKDITVTDKEAEEYYKDNIDEYKRPELYSFYNMFFADYETARKASEQLKAADKFEAAVELVMGRPASEFLNQRIPLNGLETSIAATLKTSSLNNLSGIVKTAQGYHVIKKVEQIPAINKSFAAVKTELLELVKKKKLEQKFVEASKKVEDELAAGATLSEVAKKFDLKLENALDVTTKNFNKKLSNHFQMSDSDKLFSLKEGEISDIFEINQKTPAIAVVKATKVIPEQVKSFNEVKDIVTKEYALQQKFQVAYNMLSDATKSGELSAKDKSNKHLKVNSNYKLARVDLINQQKAPTFPIELLYRVFEMDKGGFTEVFSDGKNLYTAKVQDINLDKTSSKINTKAIEDKLHTNYNNSIFEEIILDLRNKNNVQVSDKVKAYINRE